MNSLKISLIILLGMLLFTSCNTDDDGSNSANPINGVWNLKMVYVGFSQQNIGYNRGEVSWDFNSNNNMVTIQNNILTAGPENIYSGLSTGTYSYRIEQNGQTELIFVDSVSRGVLDLQGTILKIDDGIASDGILSEFER